MKEKVLFVDDDANILSGFQRNLRNRFTLVTANGGAQALEILDGDSSFAVIVSDYRMPVMTGVEFLSRAAARYPECVRVLLTGEADTRAAAAAVNQGQIFRFLTKPCPVFTLEKTLGEAIAHHHLIIAEKVLLERTLRGSMEVLTEILNLLHPIAFSRSNRVYRVAAQILPSIKVESKWEFEIAAMLSHIGCITVPIQILEKVSKRTKLSENELSVYQAHAETGRRLLEKIPRLELVAQIIASQGQQVAPIPAWQDLEKVDRLVLGAALLRLAVEVEECASRGLPKPDLLSELRSRRHHPALLKGLEEMPLAESASQSISSRDLTCGMILGADVLGEGGLLLMAKGQFLSATLIEYLQRRFEYSGVEEIVQIKVPSNA
jgi:response regulator RpfG family c-di-GMP phosphodiesterase